jgi:hypothetical protein
MVTLVYTFACVVSISEASSHKAIRHHRPDEFLPRAKEEETKWMDSRFPGFLLAASWLVSNLSKLSTFEPGHCCYPLIKVRYICPDAPGIDYLNRDSVVTR